MIPFILTVIGGYLIGDSMKKSKGLPDEAILADGGEIRRFDRQAQMDSETRGEILDTINEFYLIDGFRRLQNYLYGLFDGYDYSETDSFKDEMNKLRNVHQGLYNRIQKIYDKINTYSFTKMADGGMMGDGGQVALWKVGSNTAEKLKEGTSASIKSFLTKNKYKGLNWDSWGGAYGLQSWPADATKDEVLRYNSRSHISATSQEYADGGSVPYVLWVSKDGQKRELYGNYKSKRAAEMAMKKLWNSGADYKEIGNGPKSEYDKYGIFFADGGSIADGNNQMLRSKVKEVKHHADELRKSVKPKTEVEAWVVAKAERSASDLSDITHYLEGKHK
jgi:hypothetical protein